MASLIHQLLEILNEQATRYEELLGLSEEKRDVVISNDVESLQKITHLENLIVSQNQKLERKRVAVTEDMATVLDQKADELTLSALIELLKDQEEQADLTAARDRIKKTLDALSEINTQNELLIKNALDYTEYSLNVIRSSISQAPAYYSSTGEVFIDEPGIIDTKK